MLYKIYDDLTQENVDKMKFLLSDKLGRRQTEMCKVGTKPPALLHPQLYNPDSKKVV